MEYSKKLLSTKEASKYLNISIHKLYKMTSGRELDFIKLGNKCYFTLLQLENYILKNTVRAI